MFTGIVEALGRVVEIAPHGVGWRLSLSVPPALAAALGLGDSLAVSGVCLSVTARAAGRLSFDVSEETRRVTTLGERAEGDSVNLERPLQLGARLGGHLVLGHVDAVGRVVGVEPEGAGRRVTIEAPAGVRALLVSKGSVAVDGVSLTVAGLESEGERFAVALVPHTLAVTTLGGQRAGARVNLEMDVLGKYVRALLAGDDETRRALAGRGFLAPAGGV